MNIFKIAILAIVCVVAISVVKQLKPEFVLPLSVGIAVVVLLIICDSLYDVFYTVYNLSSSANVNSVAITCVIKVVGIGYLGEFTNNICVDANCKSIGDKVLLASKIAIFYCALPIVQQLFDIVKDFAL